MRNKNPDDLSVQEIRFLLVDKRRSSHNIRLDRFRKTGQVMPYVGHLEVMEDSGKIVIWSNKNQNYKIIAPYPSGK